MEFAHPQCNTLPSINELFQAKHTIDKPMSPNTARRHSVAFPLPKIEVVHMKDSQEDSCPGSPSNSPSSCSEIIPTGDGPRKSAQTTLSRRASVDGNVELKRNYEEIIQVAAIRGERINKRRRNVDYEDLPAGDEPWTDEEEKPKKSKQSTSNGNNGGAKYSKSKGKNKGKLECEGITCQLCKQGTPYYLHKSQNPGWRETVLAVFEYFPKRITETEWRKQNGIPVEKSIEEQANELKWLYFPDAYAFLEYHWDTLCPPQHRNRTFVGTNWRKTIQDTLSHNRTFFISGKEIFGKTGFWRLAPKAPSSICASILNGDKSSVDYNINSISDDSNSIVTSPQYNNNYNNNNNNNNNNGNNNGANLPNEYTFDAIFKHATPIKEETKDTPLKSPSLDDVVKAAEFVDFSKFELLVAAIDHLEAMNN